jgi:hypothetical protein
LGADFYVQTLTVTDRLTNEAAAAAASVAAAAPAAIGIATMRPRRCCRAAFLRCAAAPVAPAPRGLTAVLGIVRGGGQFEKPAKPGAPSSTRAAAAADAAAAPAPCRRSTSISSEREGSGHSQQSALHLRVRPPRSARIGSQPHAQAAAARGERGGHRAAGAYLHSLTSKLNLRPSGHIAHVRAQLEHS